MPIVKRSASHSSSSSHSATWTERNNFSSYEDLFYRPPMSEVTPEYSPKISDGLTCEDESEGHIRALLDVMSDWCTEQSEESESRFYKPLPPPPVEESDDEDAIRKPFGAVRALRKVMESTEQLLSMSSTAPLRLKASKASTASTPSSVTPEPKTPTMFSLPYRPFADVPQTPTSEAFVDPPISLIPLQSSIRVRSSSLPAGPPPTLGSLRLDAHARRPPPLKPSMRSLGSVQEQLFLQPGFNKSFSAPNTPTAAEFMQAKADRRSYLLHTRHSPYLEPANYLSPGDSRLHAGYNSRWSLSTAGQDDEPPSFLSQLSIPASPKAVLPRSPSRLGLNLSFSKFDLSKLVRLPSRGGNKKRLIVKGVVPGGEIAVRRVKAWCEEFGAVSRASQKPNGEIHIHYRNRAVAERVGRTHTNMEIPGVGAVTLSYDCSSKRK